MKNPSLTMLARTAVAVAVLAPATACAKPAEQATSSTRGAAAAVTGTTLLSYVARHESKLLADDTDGDGKVSRAEFLAAAMAGKGNPARRFAKFDTNGDGLLDADERAAVHARKAQSAGDRPES